MERILDTPHEQLADILSEIETWKWPRSDLHTWIKVLNKLDEVLERIIQEYNIDKIQAREFDSSSKRTLCEILRFERLLLENSTNRKTFNSYDVCVILYAVYHLCSFIFLSVFIVCS